MTRTTGSIGLTIGGLVICSALLPFSFGCGSGVQSAFLLAGESGARTFVDILLSDLLAELPNLYTFPTAGDNTVDADAGDGGAGEDPTAGDDPPVDEDPGSGLTGIAADGETVFAAAGCAVCHCASVDACDEGLINLEGLDAARIEEKVFGEGFHGGGKFPDLTEQDLADMEAFFAG